MASTATDVFRPPSRGGGGWLLPFKRVAKPKLRLFCFPYAGGDANLFRTWAAALPCGVETIAIQYPGRGANAAAPISRCIDLVEQLKPVVEPWLDCDFAFFGHSNGALISFELARRLDGSQRTRQRHHFLSARVAAHLPTGRKPISNLGHADFVQEIRRIGGTPAAVFEDASLLQFVLPRLRADFGIGENYAFEPGPLLRCDVTTLHGTEDGFVDGPLVSRWAELTTGAAEHHSVAGDHFFLNSARDQVLSLVRAKLHAILSSESASL